MAEYRMFLDESGDPDLISIDKNYPVFCLAGCLFEKNYYHQYVRCEFDKFKLHFWRRTDVILQSRKIRKHEGDFSILNDPIIRDEFYGYLNQLMCNLQYTILASVILKYEFNAKYIKPYHPYHLSLEFIMERFCISMKREGNGCSGYIMAESRGDNEDKILKTVYQKFHDQGNDYFKDMTNITGLWTEKKKANIIGMQIADLIAYPISIRVLKPKKENKAFNILYPKIQAAPQEKGGRIIGYGLKIFPTQPTDLGI